MRLLNTSTLGLLDFPASKIPKYAILSHTWREDEDEVLFTDMEKGSAESKAGYQKLRYACTQAAAAGLGYVWIDTCCIDKSSSAELSEAINSMFSWYQRADICYAYLADVCQKSVNGTSKLAIADSRWFKRGWTLQELIGSSKIIFFSFEWIELGTKSSLCDRLAKITGIDVGILTDMVPLGSTSLAKRMSWASQRETTRPEDKAYCLMGLFDINMPLLYGEGEKAFTRLQEEIMKNSDDHSLFAWTDPDAKEDDQHSLLAKAPMFFARSGNIVPYHEWEPSAPFSISNRGLRIELHLSPYGLGLHVAALDCPVPPHYEEFLGIYLQRVRTGAHQYVRVKAGSLCKISTRGSVATVYVRKLITDPRPQDIYPLHAFQIRNGPSPDGGYKLIKAYSKADTPASVLTSQRWPADRSPYTFKISKGNCQLAGVLLLGRSDGERLAILLGSRTDFGVGFEAASVAEVGSLVELQKSFDPQAPGTDVVLENHKVRVDVEEWVHEGAKYYMVDISVEAVFHTPNPIDVAIDVVRGKIPGLLGVQTQPDERRPAAVPKPPRKFKLPFTSPRGQGSHKTLGQI